MSGVTIYTTMFCGFCFRAKQVLAEKQIAFEEIDVDLTPGARQEMVQRAGGGRTVPQIFIDGTHIGGCNELFELEYEGKLDGLLSTAAAG